MKTKAKTKKHLLHYLILILLCLVAVGSTIYLPNQKLIKASIIVVFSIFYFLWGILHHTIEKDIHPEIILEYLLFSILGAGSILAVLYYL